jgi:hypothetical protein
VGHQRILPISGGKEGRTITFGAQPPAVLDALRWYECVFF